ncbi:MAG: hypothetical protein AB8G96_16835, partial [Phycisphaerales bacterium]
MSQRGRSWCGVASLVMMPVLAGCSSSPATTNAAGDVAGVVNEVAARDMGFGRDRGVLVHDWIIREPESERLTRAVDVARRQAAAARTAPDPVARAAAEAAAREAAIDPLDGRATAEDALDFPAAAPREPGAVDEPAEEAEPADPFDDFDDLVPTGPVDGAEVGAIIASLAVQPPADARPSDAAVERLRRNGLRLYAVPRGRFRDLQRALGVPQRSVETWLGEAWAWRDLATRANRERAAAVAVGDTVQRFDPGVFRLQMRAWTIRMEDGPQCQVELRLEHADTPRRSIDLLGPTVRPPGRLIDEVNFEFATGGDVLWVLAPAAA